MRARDIMVTNVITVGPEASVRDAAKILLANRISALPVVDKDGLLVGIISEGDLVRRAELGTNHHRSWWLELFSGMNKEALATRFLKSRGRKVKDVMTAKNLITAKPSTPLRAFPGGIESGGFPTAFAQAKLEKLIRLGARAFPGGIESGGFPTAFA